MVTKRLSKTEAVVLIKVNCCYLDELVYTMIQFYAKQLTAGLTFDTSQDQSRSEPSATAEWE